MSYEVCYYTVDLDFPIFRDTDPSCNLTHTINLDPEYQYKYCIQFRKKVDSM